MLNASGPEIAGSKADNSRSYHHRHDGHLTPACCHDINAQFFLVSFLHRSHEVPKSVNPKGPKTHDLAVSRDYIQYVLTSRGAGFSNRILGNPNAPKLRPYDHHMMALGF